MQRRDFLKNVLASAAALDLANGNSAPAQQLAWRQGTVAHLLPTVSDPRSLIIALVISVLTV